jgi:H+/Cl- antiporter ClcA
MDATFRAALSRWLPIIVFLVVAVIVTIWTSGVLNAPPPPDPTSTGPAPSAAPPNWLEGAVFGLFAGFIGGTLAWVAVRYPRR